jgi:hypothetical protein
MLNLIIANIKAFIKYSSKVNKKLDHTTSNDHEIFTTHQTSHEFTTFGALDLEL